MAAIETSIPLAEAKNKLSEYVDRASHGEAIIITKHGAPLAKLIPFRGPTQGDAREAVIKLKELRATNPKVGIKQIISWKNTGRP